MQVHPRISDSRSKRVLAFALCAAINLLLVRATNQTAWDADGHSTSIPSSTWL